MALMFGRLARNFIKNGYYPTDSDTTQRILNALAPAKADGRFRHPASGDTCASMHGGMRLIDPCCGEGVALAECKHHLGAACEAFGVEYDTERAWHAKEILDRCIHGDVQDCIIGKRQFGLLWLNPPYGDLVADKAATGDIGGKGRKRLEKLFYQLAVPLVQLGGVMVLIIPHYSLDRELCGWIARHFDKVRVFLAPEQQFKQVVVFGVRRRANDRRPHTEGDISEGSPLTVLPEVWCEAPYTVPAAPPGDPTFVYTRVEPRQLAQEIARHACLWSQFDLRFGRTATVPRRPLRAPSDWHLALLLAAGQVSGVVTARDGRVFVIKGDTFKEKAIKTELQARDNGRFSEIRIHTDKFVPVIRALDFTPHSPTFGQVRVIR